MTAEPTTSEQLMEEGQGLVHSLAGRVYRSIPIRVDFEDLVAYGEIGLAEAARDFDPEQGTQFSTYAYHRIRGAIYDGLSKMSWTSRAHYRKKRYQRMASELLADDARHNPTGSHSSLKEETSWFANITEKLAVVYLASMHSDDGQPAFEFEDPREPACSFVASEEISEKLRELVSELPGVERQLIHSVYFDGETLQRAADRLGITKSWASRLHARGLERLARSLRKLGVEDRPRLRVR